MKDFIPALLAATLVIVVLGLSDFAVHWQAWLLALAFVCACYAAVALRKTR